MESQDSYGTPIALTECEALLFELEGDLPSNLPPSDIDSSLDFRSSQAEESSALSAADIVDFGSNTVKREVLRELCQTSPEVARDIIAKYKQRAVLEGWCWVLPLKPTKDNGYVQVSWGGVNKLAVLQEVVLWANDTVVEKGQDASHLCHQKRCLNLSHIIPEAAPDNQARKGCRVWVDCRHCAKKLFVCVHEPSCIKYCPGYRDHEHLLTEGVCLNINEEQPVGV